MTPAEINSLPTVIRSYGKRTVRGGYDRSHRGSNNPSVTVRFPPEMFRRLNKAADEAGIPFGELVRRLCVLAMPE